MIYFLYGEDSFRSREKLKEIKDKFLSNTRSGSTLSVVDFDDDGTISTLKEAIRTGGLFSTKKLVVAQQVFAQGAEMQKEVMNLLASSPELSNDSETVLIFWESGKIKGKPKLQEYLAEKGKKQQFDILQGKKIEDWVLSRLKMYNSEVVMSPRALNVFIAYLGSDLARMDAELQKLASYAEKKTLEAEDVELMVKSQVEANIFETIEALSGGDKKKALRLLHKQLEKGDDPFYILSMYIYQFRNLLKIADYYFQGERNNQTIAKLTKLHPYVVSKGMNQLRNFSLEKIRKAYKQLELIDIGVKTGKTEIELALDLFVVNL